MVQQLHAIRLQIPEYTQLPNADAATMHRAANIDANFVQATINAIGASPSIQSALGRNPEALRQEAEDGPPSKMSCESCSKASSLRTSRAAIGST